MWIVQKPVQMIDSQVIPIKLVDQATGHTEGLSYSRNRHPVTQAFTETKPQFRARVKAEVLAHLAQRNAIPTTEDISGDFD